MVGSFQTARKIVHGQRSFETLGAEAARFGTRALLVTGRSAMSRTGIASRAAEILQAAGLQVELFAAVESDPSFATIDQGAAMARAENIHVVIGLGGGSAMDAGKVIAAVAAEPHPIREYYSGRELTRKGLAFIAVPTTAGTGSEVTKVSVLTDQERGVKESIRSDYMWPDVAIVDPLLTVSLPPEATAFAGADALTQAVEALVSRGATLITDTLAYEAVKLIARSLAAAVSNGADLEARSDMMHGSLLTGMAFANSRLGAVHALAHPLGIQFHIPHGLVCGMLLPAVLRFNLSGAYDLKATTERKLSTVAALFDPSGVERAISVEGRASATVDAIRALLSAVGALRRLGEFGVDEDHLGPIAVVAARSGSNKVNPRPASERDLEEILRETL